MKEARELLKIARMMLADSLSRGFIEEMEKLGFDYDDDEFIMSTGLGYEDEDDEYEQDNISGEFYQEIRQTIKEVETLAKKYGVEVEIDSSSEYGDIYVNAQQTKTRNVKIKAIWISVNRLHIEFVKPYYNLDDMKDWVMKNWKKIRSKNIKLHAGRSRSFWPSDEDLPKILKSIDVSDFEYFSATANGGRYFPSGGNWSIHIRIKDINGYGK